MFLVCQLYAKGPALGAVWSRGSWEEAVDLAVKMTKKQCDALEEEIREEIVETQGFQDPDGEWAVVIGLAE